MYLANLVCEDFRSYESVTLTLEPGVTAFIGPNGQGKTNLVEAVAYIATHSSHRVAADAPLVRHGASRAVLRAGIVSHERKAIVELEVNPGRANRARLNRSPAQRPRDVLGLLRTVLFAPEDLALVKGDPGERRRFLDDLLVARAPRFAGVRSDYERVLKQRNALLKSAAAARGRVRRGDAEGLATLDVWDDHLTRAGSELLAARLALVADLRPLVAKCYAEIAESAQASGDARLAYRSSAGEAALAAADRAALEEAVRAALAEARPQELERGISLVGPHRDELVLGLGDLPARGYASHGESWSFALALRLAAFELLRADGDDPVLLLDDVFAELDTGRRDRLARMVGDAEQVIITAAVADDVPETLRGRRFDVTRGQVSDAGRRDAE
ncbi:MAG TPA: DNA replication/repair protein RecF [Streptosporangiaceae bacterium]